MANWFAPGRRTLQTGIYVTGMAVGAALGLAATHPVMIPLLGDWRGAYVVYGAVGAVIALWWLLAGAEGPVPGRTDRGSDLDGGPEWSQ